MLYVLLAEWSKASDSSFAYRVFPLLGGDCSDLRSWAWVRTPQRTQLFFLTPQRTQLSFF